MKQKHELLEQCRDITRSKHTRLNLQVEQLKRTKQQIEHCTEAVSGSCSSHTAADLLPVKELMIKRIENLRKVFDGEKLIPCTSSGITTMFHCMPELGEMSDGCYPPLCVLEVPAGKPVTCTVGIKKKLRLVTMNEAGEMFGKGGEKVEAHLCSKNTSTSVEQSFCGGSGQSGWLVISSYQFLQSTHLGNISSTVKMLLTVMAFLFSELVLQNEKEPGS